MTNVTPTPAIMPSILSMVKRVKRECGQPEPTTLVGTTDKQALIVLDALNDATNDIFTRKRWEWNESLYGLNLVAGSSQYNLPADFMRMAKDPKVGGLTVKVLDETDFHILIDNSAISYGSPVYYSAHGYIFELWPTPNQEFVDQYPILQFTYYRMPPKRLDGSDDSANINLPPQFEPALIRYGRMALKNYLEYPDAGDERDWYEWHLGVQMRADRSIRPMPTVKLPRVNRKSWS